MIPFGGLELTYSDTILAVVEVAGQVKTTTHGGIYYGLIAAQAAVETLSHALRCDGLGAAGLEGCERRWRALLEPECRGSDFSKAFRPLVDTHIDSLFSLALKDGILDLVHKEAMFDWHGVLMPHLWSIFHQAFEDLAVIQEKGKGLTYRRQTWYKYQNRAGGIVEEEQINHKEGTTGREESFTQCPCQIHDETNIKKVLLALQGKDKDELQQAFKEAVTCIDKAASKGVVHKKNAARRVSRLAKKVDQSLFLIGAKPVFQPSRGFQKQLPRTSNDRV